MNEPSLHIPKPVLIRDALPSIAMIEDLTLPGPNRVVGTNIIGTAFAADARGYFLTAKHVIHGLAAENIELRTTYRAKPNDGYGMFPFPVQAIYPHPSLDIAVLAVASVVVEGRLALPLRSGNIEVGSDVVLVGYATGTDLVFCDDVLGGGSPKSFSPVAFNGMICARVPDDGRVVNLFVYDCTTFGGNSGAPVVGVKSTSIVAMHLRGYDNHVGYAVPIEKCIEYLETVAAVHEPRRSRYTRELSKHWKRT